MFSTYEEGYGEPYGYVMTVVVGNVLECPGYFVVKCPGKITILSWNVMEFGFK